MEKLFFLLLAGIWWGLLGAFAAGLLGVLLLAEAVQRSGSAYGFMLAPVAALFSACFAVVPSVFLGLLCRVLVRKREQEAAGNEAVKKIHTYKWIAFSVIVVAASLTSRQIVVGLR